MRGGEARLMNNCRRNQQAGASWANHERRVLSCGLPSSQFTIRWTLIAAAGTAYCRLVLTKPRERVRRKPKARTPGDSIPSPGSPLVLRLAFGCAALFARRV